MRISFIQKPKHLLLFANALLVFLTVMFMAQSATAQFGFEKFGFSNYGAYKDRDNHGDCGSSRSCKPGYDKHKDCKRTDCKHKNCKPGDCKYRDCKEGGCKPGYDKHKDCKYRDCKHKNCKPGDCKCETPKCVISNVPITNVTYIVDGKIFTPADTTYISYSTTLDTAVVNGKSLTVCFKAPKTDGYKTYSLVSYKAPFATFVRASAHLQQLYDFETVTVGPNACVVCLTVKIPQCFYQIDFVKGCIIEKLGPADTNPDNFYGMQNRLYADAEGGTVSCEKEKTCGSEGCASEYWKLEKNFSSWAPLVATGAKATKFFDVFSVCGQCNWNCNYRGLPANLTFLQALNLKGSGFEALARQAAAAYLNAISKNVKYGIKTNDVICGVVKAFRTGNLSIKEKLEQANGKNCPLSKSGYAARPSEAVNPVALGQELLTAYPNPFSSSAIVKFTLKNTEDYTVDLYDLQGRVVKNLGAGNAKAGLVNQVVVDNRSLAAGIYVVKIKTASENKIIRLELRK